MSYVKKEGRGVLSNNLIGSGIWDDAQIIRDEPKSEQLPVFDPNE